MSALIGARRTARCHRRLGSCSALVALGLVARKTMANERTAKSDSEENEPPASVTYDLEEALDLLAALEEARDTLAAPNTSLACSHSKPRSSSSAVDSASTTEGPMAAEPLIAAEAARRLDLPTKEVLRLVYERKIRYVMVDGIAHIPQDALDEYRRHAAS